ncbi:MAG: hypothetical protein LUI05_02190 [Oscillospiraceae bacterium]|nr:hypothetical protein [Oscillospiraceae bacterium]
MSKESKAEYYKQEILSAERSIAWAIAEVKRYQYIKQFFEDKLAKIEREIMLEEECGNGGTH